MKLTEWLRIQNACRAELIRRAELYKNNSSVASGLLEASLLRRQVLVVKFSNGDTLTFA